MKFGFGKQHSTEMALIKIQDVITIARDKKKYSLGIFIDLAKAFDTVDHTIRKLSNYGVRGVPLECFKSYLEDRYKRVRCNEEFVIVIINSRFLESPQKRSRGNQLIHRRLTRTKSIGSGQGPENRHCQTVYNG